MLEEIDFQKHLGIFMPPTEEKCAWVAVSEDTGAMCLIATPNRWRGNRHDRYAVSAADKRDAEKRFCVRVIGHAHSHVTPGCHEPSIADLKFLRDDEIGILYDLPGMQVIEYTKTSCVRLVKLAWPRKYASFIPLIAIGQG